jgi:hypothetical protein
MQMVTRVNHETMTAALDAVLVNDDPFGQPFRPALESRLLLYPIRYELTRKQFDAVARAAASVGDDAFLCAELETTHPTALAWLVTDWESYDTLDLLSNALCSPTGQWAAIISTEDHALVGGTNTFIQCLAREWPDDIEAGVQAFLTTWAWYADHGSDIGWLPDLLAYVEGR